MEVPDITLHITSQAALAAVDCIRAVCHMGEGGSVRSDV